MRTDREYQELLHRDPEQGLEEILEAFTPVVWTAAARYLPDPEDVRECVNDTFAQFYFQRDRFDPDRGTLKGLLATMARRMALDRRRKNRTALSLDEDIPSFEALTPDDRLDLMAALEKLSDQDAEMLRLKYFGGLTSRQIAQKLGMNPETVKKRQQRSLEKLRKSMLVAFVLALLALLVACGWAVLRYFGILPGYGVNTDADTPFYILEEPAAASADSGAVTVTDAVAKQGELSVHLVLEKGPEAADRVNTLPDGTTWTVYWYDQLMSMSGFEIRALWAGGEAVFTAVTTTGPGQGPDGTMNTGADRMEYDLSFACDTGAWDGLRTVTLDLGWVQTDFVLEPAREDALDAYAYTLGELGGVLAIPRLEEGRLLVDLYPLNGDAFTVETGVVRSAYGDSETPLTATGPDGALLTGQSVRFSPYGTAPCSVWDFGPAGPGEYTLHIPCVYVSAPLPADLAIPLPGGGGPWQVPGGELSVQVETQLPDGVICPGGANPGAAQWYLFFTARTGREDLTLAGLQLFPEADGPAGMSVAGLYDESGQQWRGLCASFSGEQSGASFRLSAARQATGLGSAGGEATVCYRWEQSFDISFRVEPAN